MEVISLFLPILCSFLNVYLTSSCYSDDECFGEYRCCKVRHTDEEGLCINRKNCYGFCLEIDDCSAPEICDTSRNLCTTQCSFSSDCHQGYICDDYHCVSDEDSKDSKFNIGSLIAIIIGIGAFILLICCCTVRDTRRSNLVERNVNVNTTQNIVSTNRTSRETNGQQNGEAGRLEMSSIVQETEPHNEDSSDEILDPIAEDAPPAYDVVSSQPELPPPSYEEVMRASHEILPRNENEHQV
ncbi:uncharacterized protein LOC144633795 [Oculina patagonica]